MSRRQSLDRPGILSPPGPFLTPSPSPSISASPRLQPSPSLSPFPQDVLLVAGSTITNAAQDQERKAVTPGRRQSIHQFTNGSPNAGTVVFQPSPSQSPAAATSYIGVTAGVGAASITSGTSVTGNEFNTTLVGSNNIQLNKKGNKRSLQPQYNQPSQQQHQSFSTAVTSICQPASLTSTTVAGGYGQPQAAAINTPSSFATANVAGCPKGQTKKAGATVLPTTALSQQQQQQFQQYQSSSPLIADSPIPSPSNTITSAAIKPPTPQPMQMLQQQFTIAASNGPQQTQQPQQVFQFIQGPQGQIIAAPTTQQQRFIGSTSTVQTSVTPTSYNSHNNTTTNTTLKATKAPQQILPKPQHNSNNSTPPPQSTNQQKTKNNGSSGNNAAASASASVSASNMPQLPQISNSPQPQQAQLSVSSTPTSSTQHQQQQQQIILPAGATASLATTQQPLLLNQMPVLVQQNTPQGVQLILRPPTPQLTATPSLVIQNSRPQPQLQQQQPQQLLRILGTNGATMQLAATPTFIVSSQANLIQQTANHLQTIKTTPQNPAITQLSGLHAALSAAAAANTPRSQQFTTAATINSHLLGQSVAAQLQNLQIAAATNGGSIAQIQMPNGLSATAAPATTILSQLPAQFQQNLSGTTGGLINLNQLSGANIQQIAAAAAAAGATFQTPPPQQTSTISHLTQSSPAHVPVAVTPEPLRQSTPASVIQNITTTSSPQQSSTSLTINQQQLPNGTTIINTATGNTVATIQVQPHTMQQATQQSNVIETKKKPKPRKKKQVASAALVATVPATPTGSGAATTIPTNAGTKIVFNTTTTSVNNSANTNTNYKMNTTTNSMVPTSNSNNMFSVTTNQINQSQYASNAHSESNLISAPTNNIKIQQQQQQQQQVRPKSPSPTPQITRASNGKLDLGNVMKLCGIMEDDDDEDYGMDCPNPQTQSDDVVITSSHSSTPQIATSASTTSVPSNTNDIMISIPNQNGGDSLPFTFTIPATTTNSANTSLCSENGEPQNILIKIDQNDATTPPYTISIPRLPTAEEIHQQAQQHLAQQAAAAIAQQQQHQQQQQQPKNTQSTPTLNFNLPASAPISSSQSSSQQNMQPIYQTNNTLTSQNSTILNSSSTSTVAGGTIMTTVATIGTPTSNSTTTVAVKPRRKPAVRRNGKKQDIISVTTTTISTPTVNATITSTVAPTTTTTSTILNTTPTPAQVPSQIGNIQISQVDASKITNHSTIPNAVSNAVENKIQIMPILDNTGVKIGSHTVSSSPNNITIAPTQAQPFQQQQSQQPQQQQQQIVFQTPTAPSSLQQEPTIKLSSDGRQMQLVAIPQSAPVQTTTQQQHHSTSNNTIPTAILPPQLTGMPGNVSISVGSPASAAALIPQLTGSLTLAVSEHCERLILRHDPNQPQDSQSQLILQALLKGAFPNLTIINEPTKVDNRSQQANTIQQQQSQIGSNGSKTVIAPSTGAVNKNLSTVKPPTIQLQLNANTSNVTNHMSGQNVGQQQTQLDNKRFVYDSKQTQIKPQDPQPQQQLVTFTQQQQQILTQTNQANNALINQAAFAAAAAVQSQQRYVALPKIDPSTQQLFCLNSFNNQITPISATQTAASIGPTERLLIAPAGINAQQLAQCLQQGQIHFNDVNPLPSTTQPTIGLNSSINQPLNQSRIQPQQQIVHPQPIQPLINCNNSSLTLTNTTTTTTTVTKQVANVAPIIDQSKAKLEPTKVVKKKPVRKPKTTTTAADVAAAGAGGTSAIMKNASVVKPMPKLDPLSQKPNNNPVQIVQPNIASGKQVVVSSACSSVTTTTTTTTTSNSIQPFQTLQQTTKLIGITAPMQQQPPQQQQIQQQTFQQSSNLLQTNNQRNFNNHSGTINTSVANNNSSNSNSNSNLSCNISSTSNNTNTTFINSFSMQAVTTSIANTTSTASITNGPAVLTSITTANNSNTLTQQQSQTNPSHTQPQPQQQQQHTVSRVQTIQLTPQQQQMFKQVQMQIQYLTIKLQHRPLLATTPLPPDFDPAVIAAFNKPMSDNEINVALQRLLGEQQRILASGKEIPTPEGLLPNANGGFTLISHQQNQQIDLKPNTANIPANVVQPNNHSTTTTVSCSSNNIQQQQAHQQNVAHRIHIYPMQHHQNVQQNKQKQQQQQQQQQQKQSQQISQLTTNNVSQQQQQAKAKETTAKIKQIATQQIQQQQQQHIIPNTMVPMISQQKQFVQQGNNATNSLQQQQTTQPQPQSIQQKNTLYQNSNNVPNGPPPLVFSSNGTTLTQQQMSITAFSSTTAASATTTTTASVSSHSNTITIQPQQQQQIQQQPQQTSVATEIAAPTTSSSVTKISAGTTTILASNNVVTSTPQTITTALNKSEELESTKPKLARLSLFIRQLDVDQQSCIKPDYSNPFQSKEEAVKRLIRYHCMHQQDEYIPIEEDEEFNQTATRLKDKFHLLSSKFKKLLLQESMLPHRTSEFCQVQQLMIDDLKLELDDLKSAKQSQDEWEKLDQELKQDLTEQHQRQLMDEFKTELNSYKINTSSPGINSCKDSTLQQENSGFKNEIKTEPTDRDRDPNNITNGAIFMDKFDLLKHSSNVNIFASIKKHDIVKKDQKYGWHIDDTQITNTDVESFDNKGKISTMTSYSSCNKQQYSSSIKKDDMSTDGNNTHSADVKKEFDNFDIESEIRPSFIMKKVEQNKISQGHQANERFTMNQKTISSDKVSNLYEQQMSQILHQQKLQPNNFNIQHINAKQHEDDWFCLQKELNLINSENKIGQQQTTVKSLEQIFENSDSNALLNTTDTSHIVDLFPNGCISKDSTNTSGSSGSNNSCSQERQQPVIIQQHQQQTNNQHVASISDFFHADSEVHKSVETRLEAMFGESPVHLGKSSSDSHDIESGLDDIFGDTKSSADDVGIKDKRIWDHELGTNSNFIRATNSSSTGPVTQQNVLFDNEQQQYTANTVLHQNQQHHIQLSCNNNPRWMQTMEAQFNDFMSAATTSTNAIAANGIVGDGNSDIRKRHWNGHMMSANDLEDEHINKKMCTTPISSSTSSSPLSQQQAMQHHDLMDTNDLLSLHDGLGVEHSSNVNNVNASPGGFTQLLLQQQQHTFTQAHQHFDGILDGHNDNMDHHQHFSQNHGMQPQHMHQHSLQQHNINHITGSAEFDDDISRHVQNAIDSILNLQNSESDSLNFSLDHSMGALLDDSLLDDRQQVTVALPSCQEAAKRRLLSDDLSDCLISGGTNAGNEVGDNVNNLLLDTHQQLLNHNTNHHHTHHSLHNHQHTLQQQHNLTNAANTAAVLTDFSCVSAGLDDAVKSIITS
ncbi:mucin-17 [Teleopsis dalmanni]|uniref:mucin-17 n=1 Tax=Teleopsis dalmanni TaxID=139649 RepID=UPI0018CF49EA|nr:mucin-17 [Teleopsis dalmanni]